MDKTIKTSLLHRTHTFGREHVDEEARTVDLAFASEQAKVERVFAGDVGYEILDHSPKAIRLDRIKDGGAVLVDHDPSDHVGVVESVTVGDDRVARAKVRFGKSQRASEIFQDIKDGIRKSVSVGYRVHAVDVNRDADPYEYRVSDWEPFEISIVSIPADASVGIGRDAPKEFDTLIRGLEPPNEEPKPKNPEPPQGGFSLSEDRNMTEETKTQAPEVDIEGIRSEARKEESKRVAGVMALGEKFGLKDEARQFVENGKSLDEFRSIVLDKVGDKPVKAQDPEIGMSDKEVRQFSFLRAMNALANPTDRRAQEAAAFEFEASRAATERMGKDSQGIMIPMDVLKRDLTVGTSTAGGHTVSTDLMSGSFIDLLRNRAYMMQLGTVMTGLNGNVAIPRQTGGATAYWVAESGSPTESQQAFDQVTLSPETVGAFTDFSRKLMLQSSIDVEAFVRNDLATVLALEIDRVCINGSGSGSEPLGILGTAGIGSVVGGTNGAAPDWADIVDLESAVAVDNADVGRLAYVTNAAVRGKLKQTEKASGTAQFVWDNDNMMNGYSTYVTNQVPSDLDKGTSTGVCSAILYGNFSDLLIGMWGGLDLMVDPYTSSTSGTVRVVALQDMDVAVRHAESFAAMQDALTA